MNLPWYGCSRWTCFVRSRSGSSASDQERSRSSAAYSSSWVTATRRDSTPASERLRHALHSPVADRDHVEADGEPRELGPRGEPGLRRAAQSPLLVGGDHLERIAEAGARLLLDLHESQRPPAPNDQVELVARSPDVLAEDLPAAEPVPPRRPPLGCVARPGPRQPLLRRARSRAPGSAVGARPRGRACARPPSGRA